MTENRYIKSIPITKVGNDTPNKDTPKIILLVKLSRLIPVYTPNKIPATKAITAETNTNSNVAGSLSVINSETGLLS